MNSIIIFSLIMMLFMIIVSNKNSFKKVFSTNESAFQPMNNDFKENHILKVSESPSTPKRKFVMGKAPFIRTTDEGINSTSKMMIDVIIALVPIILFAWYKNGIKPFISLQNVSVLVMLWPLLFVIVGGLTSFILEALYFALFKQVVGFKECLKASWNSYSLIPGLLLSLILPLYTPIWMLMLGCFMANIIFKMLFGGFGYNIFNPALIGYAFIMAAFGGSIGNAYLNPDEIFNLTTSSTPLAILNSNLGASYNELVGQYGNLWNYFIGTTPGSLGETSALLCVVAFIYLSVRRTINWYVPITYVGTVFALAWIIGAINGQPGIWYPTFNILTGGLLFGAVFMATEPVTSPKTPSGKVLFALFLGVFTVLFRFVGSMNEGVATSILFMCLFSGVIDRFTAESRSSTISKRIVIKWTIVILLLVGIASYTIYKCVPTKEVEALMYHFSSESFYLGGK